jgi:hypothetical protein
LLWSELAKVTGGGPQNKWLVAAEKAAAAIQTKYMVPGEFNFNGGELDDIMANDGIHSKLNCWAITGVMYGCMVRKPFSLFVMFVLSLRILGNHPFQMKTESRPASLLQQGLGALAMLTKKPEHVALVRHAADWMLANQFLRDTHYGYYQRKARFQGSDLKTAGACTNALNTTLRCDFVEQITGGRCHKSDAMGLPRHAKDTAIE